MLTEVTENDGRTGLSGGMRNAPLHKRLCGGALRDDSENGCVGDSSYVDGENGTKTIM